VLPWDKKSHWKATFRILEKKNFSHQNFPKPEYWR